MDGYIDRKEKWVGERGTELCLIMGRSEGRAVILGSTTVAVSSVNGGRTGATRTLQNKRNRSAQTETPGDSWGRKESDTLQGLN